MQNLILYIQKCHTNTSWKTPYHATFSCRFGYLHSSRNMGEIKASIQPLVYTDPSNWRLLRGFLKTKTLRPFTVLVMSIWFFFGAGGHVIISGILCFKEVGVLKPSLSFSLCKSWKSWKSKRLELCVIFGHPFGSSDEGRAATADLVSSSWVFEAKTNSGFDISDFEEIKIVCSGGFVDCRNIWEWMAMK